ncbi:Bug family tripartite tricarboxylate transporter substrate binding protein [Ottowia thiooxydans]|uniref:Bug family tripartite tricarboxylate transporter substrate binding protein n=1 Tax=Ottowia thiooxydans TaxID=219182 RepID=UPI0003F8D1B8|nr:tripartite tricarboxylate transporter substrate binding protein [Ottowia thiooxydans]
MSSKPLFRSLALVAACLVSWNAQAQSYPNRPIRFIVPYTPGGLPDVVARILAQRLGENINQSVTVDNKPGAMGSVAAASLLTSPADGYTFLLTDTAMLTVGPLLPRSLSFDPKKDLVPVSLVGNSPLYLAINQQTPATSFDEFAAYAKAKPGGVSYGSSGQGTIHHLAGEAMGISLKLPMTHIPYKGSAPSVTALVAGQVDMVFTAHSNVAGFAKSGQVKLLAVSTGKRSATTPGIPALGETIASYDYSVTIAVLGRSGIPDEVIARISSELGNVIRRPDVQKQLQGLGMTPSGAGSVELANVLKDESGRMSELFKTAKIKID